MYHGGASEKEGEAKRTADTSPDGRVIVLVFLALSGAEQSHSADCWPHRPDRDCADPEQSFQA